MNERPKSNAVFGIDCGARDRSRVGMKSGILAESNRRNTEEREGDREMEEATKFLFRATKRS